MEDNLYNYKALYDRTPRWLKRAAGFAYSRIPLTVRYGSQYQDFKQLIARSEFWQPEQLEAYQMSKLSELLHHAYKNVPYYRETFDKVGLKPADIRTSSDLQALPILTKEDLRDRQADLVARNVPESVRLYITTGGSTGIPVGFFLQKGLSRSKELAFIQDQWSRVGYCEGDRCAVIRGALIHRTASGVHWDYEPIKNHLLMSSYHITDATTPQYLEALAAFRPKFIQAYPSALTLIATYMKANNIPAPAGLRAILCGSENLYPSQRQLLEETFDCRVFSWYGHSERAVLGGECEHSSDYHLYPQYGLTEVVDGRGAYLDQDGDIGEIVATGFDNFVMPLIRYRTMDVGVIAKGNCACNRHYPRLKRIDGRLQELILTKIGRRISMTAINMHSPVFNNLNQFQFYQDVAGKVTFLYSPKSTFGAGDESSIRLELGEKLGADVELLLKPVDEIPRTPSGKYRFLIQKIPNVHAFSEYLQ